MRAAVLTGPRAIEVREVDVPVPRDDEVIVRVEANGICGSDLIAYRGRHARRTYPAIIGHEISGTVVEVGAKGDPALAGTRVCVEPNVACNACPYCGRGLPNLCVSYKILGYGPELPGGCAEFVAVPGAQVLVLPDGVDALQGSLVQHLAICYEGVVERAQVRQGETVLVLGAGPIGLGCAMLAGLRGAAVIICDTVDYRLDIARRLGVEAAVRADPPAVQAAVEEFTQDLGVDLCIEAVGGTNTDLILTAQEHTAPRGRVLSLGGFAQPVMPFSISRLKYQEQTLLGSIGHPRTFAPVIDLIADGRLQPQRWVSHQVGLEGLAGALDDMDHKRDQIMKIVVQPEAGD